VKWYRELVITASLLPFFVGIAVPLYASKLSRNIASTAKLLMNDNTDPSVVKRNDRVNVNFEYEPAVAGLGGGTHYLSALEMSNILVLTASGSRVELPPNIVGSSGGPLDPRDFSRGRLATQGRLPVHPSITLQLPNDGMLANSLVSGSLKAQLEYVADASVPEMVPHFKTIDITGQFRFWLSGQDHAEFAESAAFASGPGQSSLSEWALFPTFYFGIFLGFFHIARYVPDFFTIKH
jgi:hypothetical protein